MTFNLPGGIGLELARGGVAGVPWWLLGLAAAVLLVLLYRAERRLVSRRAGAVLLVLRLLAAGLLASFLAEPTLTWTGRVALPGRVIVAVDVSDSMDTADPLPRREVVRRLLDDPGSPLMRLARDHALEFRSFARTASPATAAGLAGSLGKPGRGDDPAPWCDRLAARPGRGRTGLVRRRGSGPPGDGRAARHRWEVPSVPIAGRIAGRPGR